QNFAGEVDQLAGAADCTRAILTGHVEEAVVSLVLEAQEPLKAVRSRLTAGGDPAQEAHRVSMIGSPRARRDGGRARGPRKRCSGCSRGHGRAHANPALSPCPGPPPAPSLGCAFPPRACARLRVSGARRPRPRLSAWFARQEEHLLDEQAAVLKNVHPLSQGIEKLDVVE